ncbi:phage portal pbsx family protein [Salmonella bongori]|nr:phage portal pbsx family protein [Salmonella bongori]
MRTAYLSSSWAASLRISAQWVMLEKVAKVFVRNELSPLQDRFREVNDWLGMEVIRFKEYTLDNPE